MKPLYIFDLDGTLADIKHRRHHVEQPACPACGSIKRCACTGRAPFKQNWSAFFRACGEDTPIKPVIDTLVHLHAAGADIWVWSGRSDEVKELTIDWLRNQGVMSLVQQLRMRPEGDYTPDEKLKRSWYDAMSPQSKQRLVAVFDDRDRMVKMWRGLGVVCFQVADGDF